MPHVLNEVRLEFHLDRPTVALVVHLIVPPIALNVVGADSSDHVDEVEVVIDREVTVSRRANCVVCSPAVGDDWQHVPLNDRKECGCVPPVYHLHEATVDRRPDLYSTEGPLLSDEATHVVLSRKYYTCSNAIQTLSFHVAFSAGQTF